MSGTSLDGISAAVVRFVADGARIEHELLAFGVTEYDSEQRSRIAAAIDGASPDEYARLNFALGEWLATAADDVIARAGLTGNDVVAIGSHGQTLWHIPRVATWQCGESAVIAERTGVDVVSDFRVRDVAAGGEGAPLVPIAESLLYSDAREWRLLQNIGGMANVTVVPPGGDVARMRAFDTGPGVVVIDSVVRTLYPDLRYDVDGAIALSGHVVQSVVGSLMRDEYFARRPPKSTGREYFGRDYAARLIASCKDAGASDADVVATAVELTARSIAQAYDSFVDEPAMRVIVSGGGARNLALMSSLRAAVAPRDVATFDDLYYDAEAKEAVAFALLACLHVGRLPGNVIGATGASGPRVLGKLTPR